MPIILVLSARVSVLKPVLLFSSTDFPADFFVVVDSVERDLYFAIIAAPGLRDLSVFACVGYDGAS